MGHEMNEYDDAVFHSTPAWHNLGQVLPTAPTPAEAARLAIPWSVELWPMVAMKGGLQEQEATVELAERRAVIRTDNQRALGIVGKDWKAFQPADVADFASALAEGSDEVKVESAGSIRGGAKVWFLLKAASFSVRGEDQVDPYILVATGFDGKMGVHVVPTTVRVQCSNTLHMVLPETESGVRSAGFSFPHVGDLESRVEAAKTSLSLYGRAAERTATILDSMADREVGAREIETFWTEVYSRQICSIPTEEEAKRDGMAKSRRAKAIRELAAIRTRWENEGGERTAWGALNGYSGWIQHTAGRAQAPSAKAHNQLLGTSSKRTSEAFASAISSFKIQV